MLKSFYRRITESLPQRIYFSSFLLFFLTVLLILSSILAGHTYFSMIDVKRARVEALDNYNYWKEIVEKHPNSPDAFYEAGFYAAELGDKSKAQEFLDEALRLDPDFEKARALSQQLTHSTLVR